MNSNSKRYRAFIGTFNNPNSLYEDFNCKEWLESIYAISGARYLVG